MTIALELNEWQTRSVPAPEPTRSDLDLAAALSEEHQRKLELKWLRGGQLEVTSSSWVGVVRLSGVTIRVRPKFAGDELGVLQMLEYARDISSATQLPSDRSFHAQGTDLLDLLCMLLVEEVVGLVRDGLMFDYSEREESLPALRGSLRFREQATRRFGQLDVLECRYDEFHADVIENQLIRTGLRVASRVCALPGLRRSLRRLEHTVGELASEGPIDAGYYRSRLTYTRRNERYRRCHELALLLIERLGVSDLYGAGEVESFAFLLNMNDVFEDFVTSLVREAFQDEPWNVMHQRKIHSVVRHRAGKRYSSIIPDIVLAADREVVPFDCKYKLYGAGGKKISSADIYQSFLYAYALSSHNVDGARAGIIFPAERTTTGPHLEVAQVEGPPTASLAGISVGLVGILQSMGKSAEWNEALKSVRSVIGSVLEAPAA